MVLKVTCIATPLWRHNDSGLTKSTQNMKANLYYDYDKYPLSPLKPRFLVLIEQYLPNISDPVYSEHQIIYVIPVTVTAPNDSKCWPIVTSSIQEPVASNCDVTMIDYSRVVALDAFSEQWCWGQWFKEFDQIVAAGYHEKCKRLYYATPRVSTRGIASMFKWEMIWIGGFVNYVSIVFNEINNNSNTNSGSILWEITFCIIVSYSYDNLRNSWLWYVRNFIIVIARCVNDWNFELFSKFRALCESTHAFSCIVEITIAKATPTILII